MLGIKMKKVKKDSDVAKYKYKYNINYITRGYIIYFFFFSFKQISTKDKVILLYLIFIILEYKTLYVYSNDILFNLLL